MSSSGDSPKTSPVPTYKSLEPRRRLAALPIGSRRNRQSSVSSGLKDVTTFESDPEPDDGEDWPSEDSDPRPSRRSATFFIGGAASDTSLNETDFPLELSPPPLISAPPPSHRLSTTPLFPSPLAHALSASLEDENLDPFDIDAGAMADEGDDEAETEDDLTGTLLPQMDSLSLKRRDSPSPTRSMRVATAPSGSTWSPGYVRSLRRSGPGSGSPSSGEPLIVIPTLAVLKP